MIVSLMERASSVVFIQVFSQAVLLWRIAAFLGALLPVYQWSSVS